MFVPLNTLGPGTVHTAKVSGKLVALYLSLCLVGENNLVKSKSSREKILIAAEELLEREGLLTVTTNRVAQESGVNISVLYRHFNNKVDIYKALLTDMEEERVHFVASKPLKLTNSDNFANWVNEIVDGLYKFRLARPGLRELRFAIPLYRELTALDAQSARSAATAIVENITPLPPSEVVERLIELFVVISELVSQVLDRPEIGTDVVSEVRLEQLKSIFHACYSIISELVTRGASGRRSVSTDER